LPHFQRGLWASIDFEYPYCEFCPTEIAGSRRQGDWMPDGDSGQVREIEVFRHKLFRISEPFITQQVQQLRRYRPLYLGRMRFGIAPAGVESLALQDLDLWLP
jgi:hypothetical protein